MMVCAKLQKWLLFSIIKKKQQLFTGGFCFVFLSNKKAIVSIQNRKIWCQSKINISEGFLWISVE